MARAAASVLLGGIVLALASCRGILGVDDLPPLATQDAGDAGTSDADDEAEAPGVRYCDTLSPAPQLCDDLGETAVYATGFDNGNQNPDPGAQRGGTLARDTTSFHSAPASLLLQTPAVLQQTDSAAAILLKTLAQVTPRLAV